MHDRDTRGARKLNFTKAALDRITPPQSDAGASGDKRPRTYVYDARTPGLAFCVTSNGARAFYLYRRFRGRPRRLQLGSYPTTTIEQARDAVARINGDIAAGRDPFEQRRAARAESTLRQIFDHWQEHHAKPRLRKWQDEVYRFDKHLKAWASRQLSEITTSQVRAHHAKIGASETGGTYAANHVLALLTRLYRYAESIGYVGPNPTKGVTRFKEESRERFVEPAELPKFLAALDDEPNEKMRDALKLMLFTGARKMNVCRMRWDDVDLDATTWTIPASEFKTGKAVKLHLSPPAMEVLRARRERTLGPWAFPGNGSRGHLESPQSAWNRVTTAAGLKDLRIHDLRRTLGSWQAAGGSSLPIIGKSLGHVSQSATAIYARLSLDPVKQSVDSATAAMLATVEAAKHKRQGGAG